MTTAGKAHRPRNPASPACRLVTTAPLTTVALVITRRNFLQGATKSASREATSCMLVVINPR